MLLARPLGRLLRVYARVAVLPDRQTTAVRERVGSTASQQADAETGFVCQKFLDGFRTNCSMTAEEDFYVAQSFLYLNEIRCVGEGSDVGGSVNTRIWTRPLGVGPERQATKPRYSPAIPSCSDRDQHAPPTTPRELCGHPVH